MSRKTLIVLLFLFLFLFRTFFGLSKVFYGVGGEAELDALQTYLIGLKSYTTNTWPYFGPDKYEMDSGFHFQIFGALEGLVTGLPFRALPIPEAPFLFLNLLSLSALGLLAWYASRKFSRLSFPFILVWVALLPWTLNQSTHVFNVSYLLFGSTLFFLGLFEAVPEISAGWWGPFAAFAAIGFGWAWDLQFHQSAVLLPPFVVGVFLWRRWKGEAEWGKELLGFLVGTVLPMACLIPTLIAYPQMHWGAGLGHSATGFNWDHVEQFLTILARYLSFACYEIPRYLGMHTSDRMDFVKAVPWIIPPAIFLTLVGWVQPFILLSYGWFKRGREGSMKYYYALGMAGFLLIWVSFWFTTIDPAAHMYFILAPLAILYSLSVWNDLARVSWLRTIAFVCLAASLWFQTVSGVAHIRGNSLYQDRDRIVRAINQKDYRILAERRPWVLY